MNRRLLALLTGFAAAALLAPMAAEPSLANVAQSDTAGTLPIKFDMVAAGRLNQAIEKLEARYPRAAGGVYLDESTGQLVLRLVDSADLEPLRSNANAAAMLESAGVGFRLETATKTEDDLRASAAQMRASKAWAGAYADDVQLVAVNLFKGVITVYASAHVDEIQAAAQALAGSNVVTSLGGALDMATLQRRNDDQPFAGGLGLWTESTANYNSDPVWCTSGFKMTKNGVTFVSEALHCGAYNTYYWNATTRVLRVSAGYGGVGGIDAGLLAPSDGHSFSDNEWWGDPTTTTAYDVSGRYSTALPAGAKVYISGGNGGLVWGYVTGDTAPCIGDDGISYGMVLVDTAASGKASVGGDSGAPVMIWNTATTDPHDVRSVAMLNCSNEIGMVAGITYMYRLENLSGATVATS